MKKKHILILLLIFSASFLSAFRQSASPVSAASVEEAAFVAGKSGGVITKEQLVKADRLYVYKYESPEHKVIHFKLSVISTRYDALELESGSGIFSSVIITTIHKCISGDRLLFEYINYVNLRGDTLTAKAFSLRVQ